MVQFLYSHGYIMHRSMYDEQRGLRSVLLDIIIEHKSLRLCSGILSRFRRRDVLFS